MFLGNATVVVDDSSWAWSAKKSASRARESKLDKQVRVPRWQIVHGELENVARRRASLDAEEARWLREADDLQIWKQFGMVSLVDYLERTLGYAPRTGQQRIRVARALGDLPELTEALSRGELAFSAVRELVRVATRTTERAWREAARGKNLRQLEQMVAGHRPGDLPNDPAEPDARLHTVEFEEISGTTYALLRQAQQRLNADAGSRLSDDAIVRAFASAVLAVPDPGAQEAEHTGRATYQIAYTVCRLCDRATQDGGGATIPVTATALAQARCNAQHVGNLDASHPERATQDIPPATVRFIHRRDHGVCQTPGCRSSIGLEIHHIVAREYGGSHDPSNLTLRCFACHSAHHEGRLSISGTAPNNLTTTRLNDVAPQSLPSSTYATTVLRTEAVAAMRGLGWSPAIAKSVVAEAITELGASANLETVLRAAIKRTPRPVGS